MPENTNTKSPKIIKCSMMSNDITSNTKGVISIGGIHDTRNKEYYTDSFLRNLIITHRQLKLLIDHILVLGDLESVEILLSTNDIPQEEFKQLKSKLVSLLIKSLVADNKYLNRKANIIVKLDGIKQISRQFIDIYGVYEHAKDENDTIALCTAKEEFLLLERLLNTLLSEDYPEQKTVLNYYIEAAIKTLLSPNRNPIVQYSRCLAIDIISENGCSVSQYQQVYKMIDTPEESLEVRYKLIKSVPDILGKINANETIMAELINETVQRLRNNIIFPERSKEVIQKSQGNQLMLLSYEAVDAIFTELDLSKSKKHKIMEEFFC